MSIRAGETLDKYQIVEEIGSGGMATVYKAYQASLNRYVAIKVLAEKLAKDDVVRLRFDREAKSVAGMSHSHILPVHDFGEQNGVFYIVTELVDGGSLKSRLGRPLEPGVAARITYEIALALDYAHRQGIIHRDVKPGNILLGKDGRAMLADFGVAKILADTQFTQTGTSVGTPAYMSPEQGKGEEMDGRSDIYSLGIVLYEMLTGRTPFAGDTPLGILHQQVFGTPPAPRELNPAIPRRLEKVILKALVKDPAGRFRTAREMAHALEQAVKFKPAEELPIPTAEEALTRSITPAHVETGKRLAAITRHSVAKMGKGGLRAASGLGKLLLRVAVVLVIAVLVIGILAALGVAWSIASFAERTIPTYAADLTGFTAYGEALTINEMQMNRDVSAAIEPYTLDTIQDLHFDFSPPDLIEVSARLFDLPVRLQGRLSLQEGLARIYVQRLNGTPLYIVGGIVSNGINRGTEQLFDTASFRLDQLQVQDREVIVRAKGTPRPVTTPTPTATLRPSPTPLPTAIPMGVLTVVNEIGAPLTLEIAGAERHLQPGESLDLELPVDSYPYAFTIETPGYQPGQGTLRVNPGKNIFRLHVEQPAEASASPSAASIQPAPTRASSPKATAEVTVTATRAPDCPSTHARITAPGVDVTVQGNVTILGTANIPNFDYYKVELATGSHTRTWTLIGELSQTPVVNDELYIWDTSAYPRGIYTLRLTVVDVTGNYQSCQVHIRLGL
jgi:tRNA A-37 threonylcarbamoyl transferase component Bud32